MIWVPFDDRFGGILERFKAHSKYLNECAKVANFKTERERYEELKRGLELLRDAQLQQSADLNIMAQTGHELLQGALKENRVSIENLLRKELTSLGASRELENRATANFQERIRELDGVLSDKIESEKKAHSGLLII